MRSRRNSFYVRSAYVLVGINVLVYLVMTVLDNTVFNRPYLLAGQPEIFTKSIFNILSLEYNSFFKDKKYYTIFTNLFVHYGILHLLFNCYSIIISGVYVESFFGKTKFLLIYMISGLGGNILTLIAVKFFVGYSFYTAGASGAVFGLFGAIVIYGMFSDDPFSSLLKSRYLQVLAINLVLNLTGLMGNVNIWGHLGGLIFGALLALAIIPGSYRKVFKKVNRVININEIYNDRKIAKKYDGQPRWVRDVIRQEIKDEKMEEKKELEKE